MKINNKLTPGLLHMNIVTMEIQKESVNFPEELELFPHLSCTENTLMSTYLVEARISSVIPFCEKKCKHYPVNTKILNSPISAYEISEVFRTRLEIESAFNYDFDWEKYKEKNLPEHMDRETEIAEALYNFIHMVDVLKARKLREVPTQETKEWQPPRNWAKENQ